MLIVQPTFHVFLPFCRDIAQHKYESILFKKCAQRENFAILPQILQISLKIDPKQYNLGKFSLFSMSRSGANFFPIFKMLIFGGAVGQTIYTVGEW